MEQEKVDINYKRGFEHGYWLKRGESQELDEIIKRSKDTQYSSGLKAGKKEATREQVRERMQRNSDQSNDVQKGIDIE